MKRGCPRCGGPHDLLMHAAQVLGAQRRAEMIDQLEARRRREVDAARARGDQYRKGLRAREPVRSQRPESPSRATCEACGVQRRHGALKWCRSCARARGYEPCARCRSLVPSLLAEAQDGRCMACTGKPTCADCGRGAPLKRSKWCSGCAMRHGWKQCSTCSRFFPPDPRNPLRRRCHRCRTEQAGSGRQGSGSSIRTVSGGLPGLGKRGR